MAKGNEPPKHPEMVKQTIKNILEKGSGAKKPDETHVQHQERREAEKRPKVDAKIEEKRKEQDKPKDPSKPIVGKFTEAEMKRRDEHDKHE